MTVEAHDYFGTAVEYVVGSISDSFTDVFQISVVTVTEMVLLAMLDVEVVEPEYVRQDDPVIFQFRLDLAPAGRLCRLQETGQQFFLSRFPETLASEMFNDGIHIGLIDGAEAHA